MHEYPAHGLMWYIHVQGWNELKTHLPFGISREREREDRCLMDGSNRQEHRKQKGRRYIGVDQALRYIEIFWLTATERSDERVV